MKQYQDLIQDVLTNGSWQDNRTGIRTLSIPGAMMRFDLQKGFPAVTTKRLAFKSVVGELCGFLRATRSAADFRAMSEIAYKEAGIVLPPGKAMLVYSRISPLVRNSGCATFDAYIMRIREDAAERKKAICALTTNHTFFYREAHHFEHFQSEVRPGLLRRLESGGKARMWSAGCSSGEETWSLVMTLLGPDRQAGLAIARRDVRVLASDIATHALNKAMAARYRAEDLKAVPEALRRPWTVAEGEDLVLAPEAQALVRFRSLNLQGDWPMRGQFDVIFCRNVMIYFDTPTKERLVDRFAQMLVPGGTLYVGHSERVTGPALGELAPTGPTVYRRRTA